MKLTTTDGQASLEAIIAVTAFIPFVMLFLATFYFLSLKAHLQFTSHELLICREFKDPATCDYRFKNDLQSFLSFGRIESIQAQKRPSSQSVEVVLRFQIFGMKRKNFKWTYKDSIALPLQEH